MNRSAVALFLSAVMVATGSFCGTRALVLANSTEAVAKDLPSYRDVVKQIMPAVVSIEAKHKPAAHTAQLPDSPSPFGNLPGLPDELRKELEHRRHQPVPPQDGMPGRAFGSGFVVDAAGIILTNDHVVRNADEVTVHFPDGRTFTSRDIKRDPKSDLAVVRIQAKEPLPFLNLGDSDAMEVGDRVLAVGAPLGLTGTVTSGIVSAKARDIHMNTDEDFLQTDAAINPGNSGGPLVNLSGQVIGINSAIKSETGGFQGIGLAISSNLAKNILGQLEKDGVVHRGYLGVQTQELAPEVAARLGLSGKGGLVIAKVMGGTPAAKAGVLDGDILTELDGQPVKGPRALQRIVVGLPVGKQVALNVLRDGTAKTLQVTVEEQPKAFGSVTEPLQPDSVNLGKLGVTVADLTADKAKQFGFSEKTEGVLITEVDPNGVAGEAGLRSGTVVLKVNQQSVKTVAEFQKAVEKSSLDEGVLLQVRSAQGGTTYVLLKAPASR
jgi:serine protease Do